ncbi:MAG: M13 family metallopeptidase [Candidatus Eremiobacteraeota bacterium]|nr:M13 family metallopeptidase [Candidatus Eremiobacteraeota bacterium]
MNFRNRARRLVVLGALVAICFCGIGRSAPARGASPSAKVGSSANFQLSWLDKHCAPCDDFYQFATGGWRKANPIPGDYPEWGQFYALRARSLDQMHSLLEHAAVDTAAPQGGAEEKVGVYYKACMNEAAVEEAGTRPLDPELAKAAAVTDVPSLVAEFAHIEQGAAPGTPFDFGSAPDPKNSNRTIGDVGQDGLSLPERDYYLNPSAASKKIRDTFTTHVAKMFVLLGDDAATSRSEGATVMSVETKIAQASFTNVELRDVGKTTNHYTVAKLQAAAPAMQWVTFFTSVGAPQTSELNVDEPSFFTALDGLLASIPIADWKTYVRWRLLNNAAPALPKAFVAEVFAFTHVLSGTAVQQTRWKRCASATENALGEAVGQLYAKAYFSAAAKARALALVDNLHAALRADMTTLPWMSPATRSYAIVKLNAMRKKIGYPNKPIRYATLVPQSDSYLANRYRAGKFGWDYDMAKIGKPTDRTSWGDYAQTVNAEYNPSNNDITFPAGILQPPFYDVSNDDALNYGAIGAVIGHETTHGFDDQGRLYDAQGNQRNWWTAGDAKRFNARSKCISDFYDTLPVDATLKQKGSLVLGEAIADLGGLTIAYKAFEKTQIGKPRVKIQGFTPEQRFFLAYATVWSASVRPAAARLQGNTDVHALPRNRAMGTLENMPQFAGAWYCPLGSKMVRPAASRCSIR